MNNMIIRNCLDENLTPIKIEYINPLDGRRVVSQSYRSSNGQPSSTKICNIATSFPQIAIKGEEHIKSEITQEVVLVNGCWDTTNKIPNIIAEMHVNTKDLSGLSNITLKNTDFDSTTDVTSPSPRGSDSGIESDCTEGNLSWLLNYKIQELPPVPDASGIENVNRNVQIMQDNSAFRQHLVQVPTVIKTCDGKSQGHCYRYSGLKKPPFTYTELIEYALSEKGELTVSGIYQWISERPYGTSRYPGKMGTYTNRNKMGKIVGARPTFRHANCSKLDHIRTGLWKNYSDAPFLIISDRDHFPFYKQNDDRWKNSVRHNLSINPHFRKGGKAVQGAGHLWTIAQRDVRKCSQIKQRISQFFQNSYTDSNNTEHDILEKELQAATDSILVEINPSYTIDTTRNSNIEVEYINVVDTTNGLEDFLAPPVSKQDIVNECGLGNDIFITDINPNVLGLNLAEVEGMADNYEDVFEYYTAKE